MQESPDRKRALIFPSGLYRIMPIGLSIIGLMSMYIWLSSDTAMDLTLRLPTERDLLISDGAGGDVIRGELVKFDGVPANLPGSWPRFRGANFDAIVSEQLKPASTQQKEVTLADSWPNEGPRVLWSLDVGEGFAGAAILAGRVYMIDYDQKKQADAIRCLSLADGSDIWRYFYPVKIKRNHGMSRTVPAVTEKYIVTMGPKGHVTCLDSMTGEFRWMLDLVRDFGTVVPEWYAGQCPIIEDGKAIIAPAGSSLMIAVDCETGEIVWQSPNPNKWKMTHSSIMPADILGMRMYVYCTSGGVVGVSAVDGRILWEYPDWKIKLANVACPLVIPDDRIFLSGGYNSGAMMLRIIREADKFKTEQLFKLDSKVFGSEQQTPILYKDHIYGIRPDRQLVCLDLDGNVTWTSSGTNRFGSRGLGPYSIADEKIYILDDEGTLTLAEAGTSGYVKLAQAKVLQGPDAWGPMAFASGRLIIRDMNRMICLDIAKQ